MIELKSELWHDRQPGVLMKISQILITVSLLIAGFAEAQTLKKNEVNELFKLRGAYRAEASLNEECKNVLGVNEQIKIDVQQSTQKLIITVSSVASGRRPVVFQYPSVNQSLYRQNGKYIDYNVSFVLDNRVIGLSRQIGVLKNGRKISADEISMMKFLTVGTAVTISNSRNRQCSVRFAKLD